MNKVKEMYERQKRAGMIDGSLEKKPPRLSSMTKAERDNRFKVELKKAKDREMNIEREREIKKIKKKAEKVASRKRRFKESMYSFGKGIGKELESSYKRGKRRAKKNMKKYK